jgi:hypothetical protein
MRAILWQALTTLSFFSSLVKLPRIGIVIAQAGFNL